MKFRMPAIGMSFSICDIATAPMKSFQMMPRIWMQMPTPATIISPIAGPATFPLAARSPPDGGGRRHVSAVLTRIRWIHALTLPDGFADYTEVK
jgi:hypothetical protein